MMIRSEDARHPLVWFESKKVSAMGIEDGSYWVLMGQTKLWVTMQAFEKCIKAKEKEVGDE